MFELCADEGVGLLVLVARARVDLRRRVCMHVWITFTSAPYIQLLSVSRRLCTPLRAQYGSRSLFPAVLVC